ncbi:multicopper oxidase family protein [Simkania sp.]|uniref:multicopper oxidase family protein n=1 Tax=Simkania sp. TaxID=34094 RepID=UPI003B52F87A
MILKRILPLLFCISSFCSEPTGTYGPCKKAGSDASPIQIIEKQITVNGRSSKVYGIEPNVIYKTDGGCFNAIVENQTSVPTTLHWHGLILPVKEDGVAYVTQPPIPPGKSQPYNLEVVQAGTFWTHSHYGLQEQKLMAAPLILLTKEKERYKNIILFFEAFTFKSIDTVWQGLRKEFVEMAATKGANWLPPLDVKTSKFGAEDLNDVDFDAFLTNQKTLDNPPVYTVNPGETVRLRLINGSVGSGFHISLGNLRGEVIAVDGSDVDPIHHSHFPLATAQRVDVLVTIPETGGAFPILAQCQGTNMVTGAILKTPKAEVPKLSLTTKATVGAISNAFEKELHAKNPLPSKKPDRTLNVKLQGNMKYYVWAINDHVWPNNQPLFVKEGERVEIVFSNETSMAHPMHFHGHVFQVMEIDGVQFSGAMRDTILVMPNQTVKVQFDANNPGIWALHCHISYHLWAGMFTVVQYDGYTPPYFPQKEIVDYSRIYGGY